MFFFVYSSDHPEIKLVVAARWDTKTGEWAGKKEGRAGEDFFWGGGEVAKQLEKKNLRGKKVRSKLRKGGGTQIKEGPEVSSLLTLYFHILG